MRSMASVIHAHMVNFAMNNGSKVSNAKYNVFNDDYVEGGKYKVSKSAKLSMRSPRLSSHSSSAGRGRALHTNASRVRRVPAIDVILKFISRVHRKAQMEIETIIVSLAYIERLLKATDGKLCLDKQNWKAIVLTAMILASKVWDDLSMWNVDFSMICPAYDLKRINHLEVVFLEAFQYNVRVPASTYAKYYFKLRSLDDGSMEGVKPIDLDGARRLETLSKQYTDQLRASNREEGERAAKARTLPRRRLHSHMDGASSTWLQKMHDEGSSFTSRSPAPASLEQIVNMDAPRSNSPPPF